jgi:putative flavoprotein involved in K+ transport
METMDAVVVGAGHAGLSISRALAAHRIEHAVLERDRVGQTWRGRWDSFCLVTPNWLIDLPEGGYDGDDPDGYMQRDEIAAFLERYAAAGAAPVREGVSVLAARELDGGFALETSEGPLRARVLVVASGAYQRAHHPRGAAAIADVLHTVDATTYRRPGELPDGGVLIVGSGQTGVQLAEELHEAGRDVVLACGKAPWLPRRFGGHDVTWWADATGFLGQPVSSLPDPGARLWANILTTGHGGGHDLHYRTLQRDGVTLAGHFEGVDGAKVRFADDLAVSVAWGDERYRQFGELVQRVVAERGLDPVALEPPPPFVAEGPTDVPLDRFSTVLFTGGFRPDYGSWLPWPSAFDDMGFPIQTDGESAVVDGLYFVGVHFLRTRKSSILWGANDDATVVASRIAVRLGAGPAN